MKISKKLEKMINTQINMEMQSAYAYLAMSAWFETTPYEGFAQWMRAQSNEELTHAMKFYDFLIDRGAQVALLPLTKPKQTFGSPLDAFKASLKQEREVTVAIHKIYEVAEQERDHESKNLLNWFLEEQMEEEKTVGDIIERLELVADDASGMLLLDAEAKNRPVSE